MELVNEIWEEIKQQEEFYVKNMNEMHSEMDLLDQESRKMFWEFRDLCMA